MTFEEIKTLERTTSNKVKVVFLHAFDAILNKPSLVPIGAWAMVGNQNNVIILKEARSKSALYAKQDIGFQIFHEKYDQHYNVSNAQFDELFGIDNWEKVWMEDDDFKNWTKERKLVVDPDAQKRQDASWISTGHN